MQFQKWTALAAAAGGSILTTLALHFVVSATPTTAQPFPIDQQIALLVSEHQATKLALQRTQMMAATYQLDTSGLHDLDERLSEGQFVPGALGRVRRARIATEAVNWPDAMQEAVSLTVAAMRGLEDALRDEDVDRAKGPAHDVHELAHDVSNMTYAALGQSAPDVR